MLQARPAESETTLSFSGLGDLLDPVLDEAPWPSLPDRSRRALARALVLDDAEGPPPDPHAVGVAVLDALRGARGRAAARRRGRRRPVARLRFGRGSRLRRRRSRGRARRPPSRTPGLRRERLVRRAPALASPRIASRDVHVGPFELGALHRVVHEHLGIALPRPLLAEVHEASGGNPFYALEIVRMLRRSKASVEAGQPLPLPESLRALVHERLLALPSQSRDYLLAASALAHPTVGLVEAACGVERDAGLGPALEARIVELDGDRIRFTHPLLAASAYEAADPLRRAQVHSCLAELVADPEARGRHLAASVTEPNEKVAAALDDAARPPARAARRERLHSCSTAHESSRLPVGTTTRCAARWRLRTSTTSRETLRGRRHSSVTSSRPSVPGGRELEQSCVSHACVRTRPRRTRPSSSCRQSRRPKAIGRSSRSRTRVSPTCFFRLYEQLEESVEHAAFAADLALELGLEALASEALGTKWMAELLLGRESAAPDGGPCARAPARRRGSSGARPASLRGRWLTLCGPTIVYPPEISSSSSSRRCDELGDASSPPNVLAQLAQVECELGELERARVLALEGQEASEQCGQRTLVAHNLALEGLAQAQLGEADRARAAAARALELVPETGARHGQLIAVRALGQLELALGDPAAAVARLSPTVAFVRQEGIVEPCVAPFVVDQIEALIELGRRDEAVELLDWYEANARGLERVSALASCLRCRGLLAAQARSLDEAMQAYGDALEWHEKVELPLDRARTLLALGAAQRRAKRRREARATLSEALSVFERIGAGLWATRTRAELRRISGRAASPGSLTPAEERVAALVAEGKTNREVAAALFLSDRTVEGHLSRIFGKLGVRSRTELARVLASPTVQGIEPSNTGDSPVSPASSRP